MLRTAVWSPHEVKLIYQLDGPTSLSTTDTKPPPQHQQCIKGMLEDLQWRTLEQRRTDCRLVLLFQIIHGLVQIPPTNYLQHSLNTLCSMQSVRQDFESGCANF